MAIAFHSIYYSFCVCIAPKIPPLAIIAIRRHRTSVPLYVFVWRRESLSIVFSSFTVWCFVCSKNPSITKRLLSKHVNTAHVIWHFFVLQFVSHWINSMAMVPFVAFHFIHSFNLYPFFTSLDVLWTTAEARFFIFILIFFFFANFSAKALHIPHIFFPLPCYSIYWLENMLTLLSD